MNQKDFKSVNATSINFNFNNSEESIIERESSELNITQEKIYEEFSTKIELGVNPQGTIAMINPRFQGTNFGVFTMPTFKEVFNNQNIKETIKLWSRTSFFQEDKKTFYVPPETGRASMFRESSHLVYRDILNKGTGLVEKFTENNKLRLKEKGFNGVLELSEAQRDMIYTDILQRAGVLVAPALAITDHHIVREFNDFSAWIGNYIRAFRVQTRISNLFDFSIQKRKAAIDDAILRMGSLFDNCHNLNYVDYFMKVLNHCAKNVAIMQAIGFTQDSFHFGQVTLCGESVDFGIGNFNRPVKKNVVNTMFPWFRYERQPILMQNILYKTHSVKAEPEPVLLNANSNTLAEQKTLFGAIKSFCPRSANEIEKLNPVAIFWDIYEKTYNSYDSVKFKNEVVSKINETYFDFNLNAQLVNLEIHEKELIATLFYQELAKLDAHYEKQIASWARKGPSSIHKSIILNDLMQRYIIKANSGINYSQLNQWPEINIQKYINKSTEFKNPMKDISWKPKLTK